MNNNEQLIETFYKAFAKLDFETMQNCYSADPIFNDAVFGVIEGNAVKSMWEMLCKNAKDFSLSYNDIECDGEYGTCKWTATYTFSKTGKKVENNVKAHMRIENGKITEHTDEFNIYKWSRQALGFHGIVLGWSGYLKSKIRNEARAKLNKFMDENKN